MRKVCSNCLKQPPLTLGNHQTLDHLSGTVYGADKLLSHSCSAFEKQEDRRGIAEDAAELLNFIFTTFNILKQLRSLFLSF